MLAVEDVLKINELSKMTLIAGNEGVSRKISAVTIMENPDISQWIKGGEFLISCFYTITDDIDRQCNVIRELNDSGISAIALKIGKNMKEISKEIIELANKLNLPLFEIPSEVTYMQIMLPISNILFEIEHHLRILEEYAKMLVFHTYRDNNAILEYGLSLDFQFDKGYFYVISIGIDGGGFSENITLKDKLYYYMESLGNRYKRTQNILNYVVIRNLENVTIFIQGNFEDQLEKTGKVILEEIVIYQNHFNSNRHMTIGVSNIIEGLDAFDNGYRQAEFAAMIGSITNKNDKYYSYKKMEIFSIFCKNSLDDIESIRESSIGKILGDKEMVETLSVYFDCNENIVQSSEKLFIHKNTLKYRLDKIKIITGLDVKNIEDKVKLYFGSIANEIMNKRQIMQVQILKN